MNLQQLKYLREVARCGLNISTAANVLHTAQPGISNQIRQLEDELNIQIFERNGNVLTVAGSWGVLPGQLFRPKGVAVDATGAIYVSDSYMGLIEVFDNTKQFSYVLGKDNAPYKFITPAGITLDKHQRIYVTEMLSNKVSVYKLK